jgi:hypothetical protein
MSNPLFRTMANSTAYALLFLVFLTLFWNTFSGQIKGVAIDVHATTVTTPILKSEGTLGVDFDSTRYRLCRTDVDRYLLSVPDNKIFYRERIVGGVLGVGRAHSVTELKLPALPPGKYVYRGFIHSDCGDNDRQTAQQPDGPFEVVR